MDPLHLPPTPPSSHGSDSEGGQSPARSLPPSSPIQLQATAKVASRTASVLSSSPLLTAPHVSWTGFLHHSSVCLFLKTFLITGFGRDLLTFCCCLDEFMSGQNCRSSNSCSLVCSVLTENSMCFSSELRQGSLVLLALSHHGLCFALGPSPARLTYLVDLYLSSCHVISKWRSLGRDFQWYFSCISFPVWAKDSFTVGLSVYRAGPRTAVLRESCPKGSDSEWKLPKRSSTHSQLQGALLVGLVLSEVRDLPLFPNNLFF